MNPIAATSEQSHFGPAILKIAKALGVKVRDLVKGI
jgi:hypothetical protein